MKILLISPLGYAINGDTRYSGIEQLVYNYAKELNKEHDVAVLGHVDSIFPDGITFYPSTPVEDVYLLSELNQYQTYQNILKDFDVIHDFSHQHLASRYNKLPSVNVFWHAPSVAQFIKAPYNIVGLSLWACREFERVYKQKARYMQTIALDTSTYKLSNKNRNDRFLCLGRITPNKGVYETCMLCKDLKLPLDVVGKGDGDKYDNAVRAISDGINIRYNGEVEEKTKVRFYQTCRALIYMTTEPEVGNQKIKEAMMCGAKILVSDIWAINEIVSRGVDGWFGDIKEGIDNLDKLNIKKTYECNKNKYSIENMLPKYVYLYKEVVN